MSAVRRALQENPRLSVRRNGTNIPRETFNSIVRLDLNWFPYRMQRRHEIKDGDFARREFSTAGGLTTVVMTQDFLTQSSSETRPLFH